VSVRIETRRACLRYVGTRSTTAAWQVAVALHDEPRLPDDVAALLADLHRYTVTHRANVLGGTDEEKQDARMRVSLTLVSLAGRASQWCLTRDEVLAGELAEVSP
jgi:hypothetical protein